MKFSARLTGAGTTILLLICAAAGPAHALQQDTVPEHAAELITVTPDIAQVLVPGPGHSESWTVSVTNTTQNDLPLGIEVLGDATSALFTGPTPLMVSLADSSGAVVAISPAAALIDRTLALPTLLAGESTELHGTVTLPADADNRYAAQSGELRFRVTATAPDDADTGPGLLSATGALASSAAWLALVLSAAGIITFTLCAHSRRRKARTQ